jgi:hypothetical protein
MVGNEMFLSAPGLDPEGLERLDGVDLRQVAARGFPVEPGEEAGDRHPVPQVGGAGARDLRLILHRLHEGDGVGSPVHRAPGRLDAADQGDGAGGGIDPDLAAPAAEAVEGFRERTDRREIRKVAHGGAGLVRDLGRVEEEARPALLGRIA